MSKAKKITYKEIMERLNFVMGRVMQIEKTLDYDHTLLLRYIECKGDVDNLKEFLKEQERKENEQTDRSSPKADRDRHERDPETQNKVEKIRESMDAERDSNKAKESNEYR